MEKKTLIKYSELRDTEDNFNNLTQYKDSILSQIFIISIINNYNDIYYYLLHYE